MHLHRNRLIAVLLLCSVTTTKAELVWTEKANFGGEARHRAVGFAVGERGYMGLGHYNSIVDILFEDIWEYDPSTNTWAQKADFPGGKMLQCVAFTIGQTAYVGTGRDPMFVEHDEFYAYNPKTNTWTEVAAFEGSNRHGAVAFAINGKGYVVTGSDGVNYKKD
ncbi:MAG TPA: hypothetical protein PKO19_14425, partial [Chitinophagales bacterium]|nr:hypothetical protein [Chitinophagales bacterium]